jgi:predicted metalloprotease with PDZ domain
LGQSGWADRLLDTHNKALSIPTFKRRRFQTIGGIQENAIRELRAITESAFQEVIQQWKKGWKRCIASREYYIEGDSNYCSVN